MVFVLDAEAEPKIELNKHVIYPDPEIERDVYVPRTSIFPTELIGEIDEISAIDDRKQFFELLTNLQQQNDGRSGPDFAAFAQFGNFDGGNSGSSNPFFANINAKESPKVPETRLQKYLSTKINIAVLAVLTYLLIVLAPFHWNVFLIFLGWEIAEIFIIRQHESNPNGMINMVFMLAGISSNKINIVLKWVQLLNKVLRDVALFMFFFVLCHVFYVYWSGDDLVTAIGTDEPNHKIFEDDSTDDVFAQFNL